MTIKDLIERLEQEDPEMVVPNGFGHPHSYRGNFEDLAVEPKTNTKVKDMHTALKGAVGKTFIGYKGGEYTMDEGSRVYLSEYGFYSGVQLSVQLLSYMLKEAQALGEPYQLGQRDMHRRIIQDLRSALKPNSGARFIKDEDVNALVKALINKRLLKLHEDIQALITAIINVNLAVTALDDHDITERPDYAKERLAEIHKRLKEAIRLTIRFK